MPDYYCASSVRHHDGLRISLNVTFRNAVRAAEPACSGIGVTVPATLVPVFFTVTSAGGIGAFDGSVAVPVNGAKANREPVRGLMATSRL
jgi:hypothetical protein